jgi:hypothetical protein
MNISRETTEPISREDLLALLERATVAPLPDCSLLGKDVAELDHEWDDWDALFYYMELACRVETLQAYLRKSGRWRTALDPAQHIRRALRDRDKPKARPRLPRWKPGRIHKGDPGLDAHTECSAAEDPFSPGIFSVLLDRAAADYEDVADHEEYVHWNEQHIKAEFLDGDGQVIWSEVLAGFDLTLYERVIFDHRRNGKDRVWILARAEGRERKLLTEC